MPNRYFIADPMVTGAAQYLAGFGRRRQEVADANVATQSRQNQLFGQGMGDVVGGFFGQQTADRQFNMQQMAQAQRVAQAHQNRMVVQQAYDAGRVDLENLRSANAAYEYEHAAFVKQWGMPPEAVGAQMTRGGASGQGPQQPVPGGGPPEPPRSHQPADQSQLQEYRKLEDEAKSLRTAVQEAIALPDQREANKRLMQIIPELARKEKQLRSMEAKPQTAQEKFDADYATRDGIGYRPDGKGGWDGMIGPKFNKQAYMQMPREEQEAYVRSMIFGPVDKMIDAGWLFSVQADGSVKAIKPDEQTPAEMFAEAWKNVAASRDPDDPDRTMTLEKVMAYQTLRENFEKTIELKPKHDALMQRGGELLQLRSKGTANRQWVADWLRNAILAFGPDTKQWSSAELRQMADKMSVLYYRLGQKVPDYGLPQAAWEEPEGIERP